MTVLYVLRYYPTLTETFVYREMEALVPAARLANSSGADRAAIDPAVSATARAVGRARSCSIPRRIAGHHAAACTMFGCRTCTTTNVPNAYATPASQAAGADLVQPSTHRCIKKPASA